MGRKSRDLVLSDRLLGDIIRTQDIKVFCIVVVAFKEGIKRIEETLENLRIEVHFHKCEVLDDTAKAFSRESTIFRDENDREVARRIAQRHGKVLEKECPLGYGNLEAAVVFEHGCPNNSLPILWSESTNPPWIPLFRRH